METKINLIGIICTCLLLLSCYNQKKNNNQDHSIPIQKQWNIGLKDSTLIEHRENFFVIYHLQGDTAYSIEWGNDSIKNMSMQKFEVLGNGVLGILRTSENCILLSQGCGTSCTYYVILPMKRNMTEKVYYFALANDLKNNFVAYMPSDNNDDIFVRVENYLTGQVMDIKETNVCQATSKSDCIDSVYFNKSSLVLKWQDNQQILREREIPIKFPD